MLLPSLFVVGKFLTFPNLADAFDSTVKKVGFHCNYVMFSMNKCLCLCNVSVRNRNLKLKRSFSKKK